MRHDRDSIKAYLNSIGKIPLLTAAEEIHLGHQIQNWVAIRDIPKEELTKEQRRVCRTGQRAYDRMLSANLRLVVSCAKKYTRRCVSHDLLDLIQEGTVGLMRAVEKFDPERGYKFSTYAYWWIRQGITRAIGNTDRMIRLPANTVDRLHKIRDFAWKFFEMEGRQPTHEEIAEGIGCTVPNVDLALRSNLHTTSIDRSTVDNGGKRDPVMHEILCDPDAINPMDLAENEDQIKYLHGLIDKLDEKQQRLIYNRFFTEPEDYLTSRELAEEYGCGRYTIELRLKAAILKLRKQMRRVNYPVAS
jgi:RNA polymerase primary sigma factor